MNHEQNQIQQASEAFKSLSNAEEIRRAITVLHAWHPNNACLYDAGVALDSFIDEITPETQDEFGNTLGAEFGRDRQQEIADYQRAAR